MGGQNLVKSKEPFETEPNKLTLNQTKMIGFVFGFEFEIGKQSNEVNYLKIIDNKFNINQKILKDMFTKTTTTTTKRIPNTWS